jgi:menaquinone-dependent protoporphyrinogen oxidase
MEEKVLVAYASKYGSTKEVAEAVAAVFRGSGLAVDLQPMRKAHDLEPYRTVILGAPLYIGRWHAEMRRFLSRHREALSRRAPLVFTLGPTTPSENEWRDVRTQLEMETAQYPWLDPAAVELFGGKYDPAALRFPDSLLAGLPASPLHGLPASDARDWEAIRRWAQHRIVPKKSEKTQEIKK